MWTLSRRGILGRVASQQCIVEVCGIVKLCLVHKESTVEVYRTRTRFTQPLCWCHRVDSRLPRLSWWLIHIPQQSRETCEKAVSELNWCSSRYSRSIVAEMVDGNTGLVAGGCSFNNRSH